MILGEPINKSEASGQNQNNEASGNKVGVNDEMPLENIVDAWKDIIQELDNVIGGVSDIEQESAEDELLPGTKFEFHKVDISTLHQLTNFRV